MTGARIGLLGHSEGAIVAAIAAAKSRDVGFIVWMAGSAVPGREILEMQAATLARLSGATEDGIAEILRHHAAFMTAVIEDAPVEQVTALGRTLVAAQLAAASQAQRGAAGDAEAIVDRAVTQSLPVLRSRWMRAFVSFDPATALRRVACPVFAAFGERDLQVPAAANRTKLEGALRESGNQNVTVRVYSEANHLFMRAITGRPAEYATLPKVFVPPLLDDLAAWMAQR